jgi:hypothetical protein
VDSLAAEAQRSRTATKHDAHHDFMTLRVVMRKLCQKSV